LYKAKGKKQKKTKRMPKKCPPGVVCIENVTLVLIVVIIFAVIYFTSILRAPVTTQNVTVHDTDHLGYPQLQIRPNYGYTNLPGDVLMNPYAPPLRDERYAIGFQQAINIPTNVGAIDTTYRQIGLLTPLHKTAKSNILPLMGRPLYVNRDKWQYYSMSDQNNSVKLPLRKNGRSCTDEYGCDKLCSGETVHVEGYNETFRTTMYDNEPIRYIPYL